MAVTALQVISAFLDCFHVLFFGFGALQLVSEACCRVKVPKLSSQAALEQHGKPKGEAGTNLEVYWLRVVCTFQTPVALMHLGSVTQVLSHDQRALAWMFTGAHHTLDGLCIHGGHVLWAAMARCRSGAGSDKPPEAFLSLRQHVVSLVVHAVFAALLFVCAAYRFD